MEYRERHRLNQRRYRQRNLERVRARVRQWELQLKVSALKHYHPEGKAECASCSEKRVVALTLSHLNPIPELPRSGSKLYRALERLKYPELPLLTECISCNVVRDNWGRGYHVERVL